MVRIHHPLPGMDLDISPTARFGGYPMACTDESLVVADETTNRFIALITGQTQQKWHRDIQNSLGVPAVRDHVLYTGFGGPGGVSGLVAVDTENGKPLWTYPPNPPQPDPQQLIQIQSPKAVPVPVYGKSDKTVTDPRTGRQLEAMEFKGYGTQMVPVPVDQPYATEPFQHWSNSGLVVTKDVVYGEVDHKIVALGREEGNVLWSYPLGPHDVVSSLVATPQHLVFCISTLLSGKREPVWAVRDKTTTNRLVAVDLKEGKEVWYQNVPRPGNLALSNGLLFFTDGALHVLGPAEDSAVKVAKASDSESSLR